MYRVSAAVAWQGKAYLGHHNLLQLLQMLVNALVHIHLCGLPLFAHNPHFLLDGAMQLLPQYQQKVVPQCLLLPIPLLSYHSAVQGKEGLQYVPPKGNNAGT